MKERLRQCYIPVSYGQTIYRLAWAIVYIIQGWAVESLIEGNKKQ